jgi:hypothetical protein
MNLARLPRNQTQSILQEATEETESDQEERGNGQSVNGRGICDYLSYLRLERIGIEPLSTQMAQMNGGKTSV